MLRDLLQFEGGPDPGMLVKEILDGAGPWPLPLEGRTVLCLVAERRSAFPISLRGLVIRTGLTEREIKAMVRSLIVDFGVPIGALRGVPGGYYLAATAAERATAARPLIHEIRSLARRVRALVGTHEFVELLGQMRLGDSTTETGRQGEGQ